MNRLKNFPYKRVLVLGLAKSGTATCKVLNDNQIEVVATDLQADPNSPDLLELKDRGIELYIGSHPDHLLETCDLVVKNPGIPYHVPFVQSILERDIPIWTEIECLYYLIEQPVLAITGSNGKTTTSTLAHDILIKSKQDAQLAGNIGQVAIEVAQHLEKDQSLVLELSSFQLMGINQFKPKVSILLNLFESHLDYHGDFDNYRAAKAAIFKNQTTNDYLVYNADDKRVKALAENALSRKIPFSRKEKLENGVWMNDHTIFYRSEPIIDKDQIRLVGDHNLENVLASIAATLMMGATKEGIQASLTSFNGVTYRLQFIRELNNRLFYNDSKATNSFATSKALSAFDQPIRLIAGGLDRGNGFDELIPYLDNVEGIYLYGETKDKLASTAQKANIQTIKTGEDLVEMTHKAYNDSNQGDVILLSPACASWDQFKTFEDRGDMFSNVVHTLL
ncbi:UDP-N-acetylmuramoylalanine--D-glutamate ligase [Pelagirhabdus alkalitolerans]|uniref:UDP-N-acetylmuramoylalanine--D-glutamate ligase n=1 Tax=Pelagirhabdus alkalitolerans TaxID=1612202 RepID=A0A1G6H098_9BACI|nr:UDP-N-acetylmuramoyl-L-alanine--D-glutamate ligase [Pelagirhabdus alkalitolerans]SDB87573.1 UDP-N-acetylmuramoylalanine--D-glutamate ligase [Pelagirhabdus alkalitolerans]